MDPRRIRVSGSLPGGERIWSVIQISYPRPDQPEWVEIRHVRGQAPPAAMIAAVMVRLGLVAPELAIEVSDQFAMYRAELPVPAELRGVRIACTERYGSSGAMWRWVWEVGEDGWRRRLLARWHVSMRGALNEPVEGIASVLFSEGALQVPGAALWLAQRQWITLHEERRFSVEGCEPLGERATSYSWPELLSEEALQGALDPLTQPAPAPPAEG